MQSPGAGGASGKFGKQNLVVPVPNGDGVDSEAGGGTSVRSTQDGNAKQFRISLAGESASGAPSFYPWDNSNGGDVSVHGAGSRSGGSRQYNKIAAQVANKVARRPSKQLGGADSQENSHPHQGPWSILKEEKAGLFKLKQRWQGWSNAMLIRPFSERYQRWFYFTVIVAVLSGWVIPFQFAFQEPGALLWPYDDWVAIVEYVGTAIFFIDFLLKFNVTFFDPETAALVTQRAQIGKHYMRSWYFLLDVLGWFPFDWIILEPVAASGASDSTLRGLSWIKLLHLARLYRVFDLFTYLDRNLVMSQGVLMVTRNYTFVFFVTHWAACMLYNIASLENFSSNSWVGRNAAKFSGQPTYKKYLLSLYFSVSAFTGLGDSALYASTVPEAAFMIIYLLFNLFLGAYILGTVTMLVVTADERSKHFRDRINHLNEFSRANELPERLHDAMKDHLEVTFHSEQLDDERVLAIYPTTIRRKVLRHLYLQPVRGCYLFKGCKQRFLDALLGAARVELFMPGVQIMVESDNVTELLIVVSGEVLVAEAGINVAAAFSQFAVTNPTSADPSSHGSATGRTPSNISRSFTGRNASSRRNASAATSLIDVSIHSTRTFMALASGKAVMVQGSSDALAEVPFFTDVPSNETIMSQSVVRVLSLPKSSWENLMQQFPQQARLVLTNLQNHAELLLSHEMHEALDASQLPESDIKAALLQMKEKDPDKANTPLVQKVRAAVPAAVLERVAKLDDVRAVVRAHVRKVDQLRTFEFLNATSNGDVETLRTMLSQGMSPNCADYDGRTGLMLSAAGGYEAIVRLLLDSGAKTDQLDAFGNSAMTEAVKNAHDEVIDLLLSYGGSLAMDQMTVASIMCTAVFEGDVVKLRRLLRSGAPPDACDYDKRAALHIAGAEGNVSAVKLLIEEGGADPNFQDRWGNTALDEARRVGAAPVVTYLENLLGESHLDGKGERYRKQVATEFLASCGLGDKDRVRFIAHHSQPGCLFSGLVVAASKGHREVVETLVAWVPPDVLLSDGPIAMVEAAHMGHVSVVNALRAAGVQLPNPRDPSLLSCLHTAVVAMDAPCVAAMLAAGVDAAAAAPGGGSLLHSAAATESLPVVRRLVEEGGLRPGAEDSTGKTPAAIAEAASHLQVAEYLRWAASVAAASSGAALAAAAAARFGPLQDHSSSGEADAEPPKPTGLDDDLPLLLAHMGSFSEISTGSRRPTLTATINGLQPPPAPMSKRPIPAAARRTTLTAIIRREVEEIPMSPVRPVPLTVHRDPNSRTSSFVGYVADGRSASRQSTANGYSSPPPLLSQLPAQLSIKQTGASPPALQHQSSLAGGNRMPPSAAFVHGGHGVTGSFARSALPALPEDEPSVHSRVSTASSGRMPASAAAVAQPPSPPPPPPPPPPLRPSSSHHSSGGPSSPRISAVVPAAAALTTSPSLRLQSPLRPSPLGPPPVALQLPPDAATTASGGSRRTSPAASDGPDALESFLATAPPPLSRLGTPALDQARPTASAAASVVQPAGGATTNGDSAGGHEHDVPSPPKRTTSLEKSLRALTPPNR